MLVEGTLNPDNLSGTDSDDVIVGHEDNDTLFGLGGADIFNYYAGHSLSFGDYNGSVHVDDINEFNGDGDDVDDGGTGNDTFHVTADYLAYTPRAPFEFDGPMGYSLTAGSDGAALFTRYQAYTRFVGLGIEDGSYTSTVTLKSIENFSFVNTHDPAPAVPSNTVYTTDETVIVGDLSSTGMTGQLTFDLGSGNDTLYGDLFGDVTKNSIIAWGGSGNDNLNGGLGNDTLYGQEGADGLSGGGGTNTLVGGPGDDSYGSDNPADTLIEQPNEGYDTLATRANYAVLPANFEKLFFYGEGDFIGIANTTGSYIEGGRGSDYLIGRDGNDILYGMGGAANALQGGKGDDIYVIESKNDSPIEFVNEGHDTVLTTLTSYTLRANFEDLSYSGHSAFTGTGNDLANSIQGNDGDDHLIGLGGNDTLAGLSGKNVLEGGTGDDLYLVTSATDKVVELANAGHDTVQTTLSSFTLSANVEDLTIQNGGGSFTGNDLANVIKVLGAASTVYGGGGDDTLIGGAGNDSLVGGSGNDRLIGGLGGNELTGGTGADHFVFKTALDGSDLIHDFSRAEGDKIDVSQLLNSLGPIGADPFSNGVLTFQPIAAFGSTGVPATRVMLDIDGSAGPAAPTQLIVALGGTSVIDHNDFIIV
jgi:Ca2+-binding RTX toxin-like protein